jgi:hypothetical protein
MHPELVPPAGADSLPEDDRFRFKTEYDVTSTLQIGNLQKLGNEKCGGAQSRRREDRSDASCR